MFSPNLFSDAINDMALHFFGQQISNLAENWNQLKPKENLVVKNPN